MKHSRCSTRIIFYSLWIFISIIQAKFTELSNDEAYYWMYSTQLAWGYFDHPPLIALLVKMGYFIFHNELGVRFFIILLNVATIFLIEKIVQPASLKLFYVVIASILLINYGGILAIPDNPLLFFVALFFYLYKKYTQKPSALLMLLLGAVAALMLLSKYLGALVIFFTLLSNTKLLLKPITWLSGILTLAILCPHVYWLYLNDFPSVKYQLFARSATVFDITYTLEYLFTQPLIYGPIIGVILFFAAFKQKHTNGFEKTMKYNLLGVFLLFFLFTFKGKVEAHWTDVALVPLIFMGYKGILESQKLSRFVLKSFPVSLLIIFTLRIYLIIDFIPKKWNVLTEFHSAKYWVSEIKMLAGNRAVIFDNSYQNASKYAFYSQSEAITRCDQRGRANQFDIWQSEEKMQNRPVLFVSNFNGPGIETLQSRFPFHYYFIQNYSTYPFILVEQELDSIKVKSGSDISIKIKLSSEEKIGNDSAYLYALFFNENNYMQAVKTSIVINDKLIESNRSIRFRLQAPNKGKYSLFFAISKNPVPSSVNSSPVIVLVE